MLDRRAEPSGDQQGAELVAVQNGGVRLVVHPWPPDTGGRGVLEELLLDRVLVEPGDGTQAPGDSSTGTTARFQVAGEALDVSAADGEHVKGAGAAPASELAQVQRVGLPGQAAVPGQEPGEREPFGVSEGGLAHDVHRGGGQRRRRRWSLATANNRQRILLVSARNAA